MITNILLVSFIFIEIYKVFYPEEYNIILNTAKKDLIIFKDNLEPKIFFIAYNIIYYYSCCEIYLNKAKLFIKPLIIIMYTYIENLLKKYKIMKCSKDVGELVLDFFYEGKFLTTINFDKNNKDINFDKAPINYDFIVCTDFNNSTMANKICVSNIYHYIEYDFDFEITNFTFLSLQLIYKDNNYNIELKNDNYNFYIVNNVLDKNFFTYYLKYILNLDNLEREFSYNLELLDQDVEMRYFSDKDILVLNKESYTIVNNDEIKELFK